MRFSEADLWEEISFLAFHLHWDLDRLLSLEHADRQRLLSSVSAMNQQTWELAAMGG